MDTPTREVFAHLADWEVILWYCLAAVSLTVFAAGLAFAVLKYKRGRDRGNPPGKPLLRARRALAIVLSHTLIKRRDGLAGMGHAAIFYGFVVLLLGSVILALNNDFTEPFFSFDFWQGDFYLGFSLFMDLFGALLLVGLALMGAKRLLRPLRFDYRRPDRAEGEYGRARYVLGDWVFLGMLLFLAVSGFAVEAVRIAEQNPSFEVWSPVGWTLGQALRSAGLYGDPAAVTGKVVWWVHGLAAFGFISSIPFTKAVHMLVSPVSVALRDEDAGRALPPVAAASATEELGYSLITDLSPKYLLQVDACTRCGKCHAACPATSSAYPLSPRELVLDIRECAERALGMRPVLGFSPLRDELQPILGDPLRYESLWSCMQCLACLEICPVGIEHVPIIAQLRRRLMELGEIDPILQPVLEKLHQSGNSFGEARRKRPRWAKELDFAIKDIRKEPAELLWFVGDYASFDLRNQRITAALARILHHAGVDFGILYDGEQNAGNDVRRTGEEGLFLHLSEANTELISGCEFDRILTSDPHSYNTLKNEYSQVGGNWPVVHHSQYLLELLQGGKVRPASALGYRITYHDPCSLGRYNGVYEPPRRVLAEVGCEVVEMPRTRDNSFCCGAGGGRIWMTDFRREGVTRPGESRIEEAVGLGDIQYFVVACPKDVAMYEDAIKTSGHEGEIALRELSELVLESLGLARTEPTSGLVRPRPVPVTLRT